MEYEDVPDFPEICAVLLSVDAWHLVDHGRVVRDEEILLLETRSALRAMQSAYERHRNTFPARQFGTGSVVDQGKNAVFYSACRHPAFLLIRISCQLTFGFPMGDV